MLTWINIETNSNDHGWVSEGREEGTIIEHHAKGYIESMTHPL
jgi:hypothetical protein